MAFNNYNMNNQNSQQSGQKKSWKVGKDVYTSDGKIAIGLYESARGGVYCSFQITSAIGKDPQTGMNVYEQRMPQDLPSILFTQEVLEAFINRMTDKTRPCRDRDFYPNWVDPSSLNETIDCGHNAKFTIAGSTGEVKISMKTDRGEKSTIFSPIHLSSETDFPGWRIMLQKMFFVLSYMQTSGIDPDKFASVMSNNSGGATLQPTEDSEMPI